MKKTKLIFSIIATAVLLLFTAAGCGSNSTENEIEDTAVMNENDLSLTVLAKDITEEESEALIFMREEEKLARDIYISFYKTYGLRIFNNISKSEQQHMNAIKVLLDLYEIQDPVKDDITGKFENQDLQDLFDQLLLQGNASKTDALAVGAAIEEIDILDLLKSISNPELKSEIFVVFNNLKKGSENHLRSFVRNLQVNGIDYEAQYLDEEFYKSIINR